jgi:hypothetical protein
VDKGFLGLEDQWWERSLWNPPARTTDSKFWLPGAVTKRKILELLWNSVNSKAGFLPSTPSLSSEVSFDIKLWELWPSVPGWGWGQEIEGWISTYQGASPS